MKLEERRLAVALSSALVFWGLPIALIAPRPYLPAAILLLAVVGAANSIEDVAGFTLLQRIVPDELLSRTLGVVWGLAMGAVALGSVAAPALVALLGPRAAFAAVGGILPGLTVELDVISSVPLFEPLSLVAKEHLAGKLTRVHADPGDVVVRTGDAGDRFYIVDGGELEITNGASGHAGSGDFFGEIALLRDVPRTATVRAVLPTELYALDREDFLAAVTHSAVRAAGEAVADERLAPRVKAVPR